MLSCYNRGCGKDFDPTNNPDDSCRFHPGSPFFHDAYKGWSCCNRKSVDFTEFLNIKGCQLSKHSNVKPIEPEKPKEVVVIEEEPPQKIPEPVKPSALKRPPFDSELTTLKPTIAPALKQSIDTMVISDTKSVAKSTNEIPIGTTCKNGGCNLTYDSPASDSTECVYHPGVPIFHEGLKFWSCCTKRTTDFTAFMNQKGCAYGKHKWLKDAEDQETVKCRYDWHQTAANVVIAIYAKLYHYEKSFVKINPVRLMVRLVFPQQNNAEFNIDLELRGIVNVSKATVQMLGSKIEITLPKAEPGHWVDLEVPKTVTTPEKSKDASTDNKPVVTATANKNDDGDDSDIDLDDIEQVRGVRITDA